MIIPVEKIWNKYENKYKAINVAALEARRLKAAQGKGLIDQNIKPIFEAIRKMTTGKIKYTEE